MAYQPSGSTFTQGHTWSRCRNQLVLKVGCFCQRAYFQVWYPYEQCLASAYSLKRLKFVLLWLQLISHSHFHSQSSQIARLLHIIPSPLHSRSFDHKLQRAWQYLGDLKISWLPFNSINSHAPQLSGWISEFFSLLEASSHFSSSLCRHTQSLPPRFDS